MKCILSFFLVVASVFIGPAYAADLSALPQTDFSELRSTGTAKVSKIIDPYTIELTDGRLIRLSGLDFPDFSFTEAGELSLAAMSILEDMLKDQTVRIYQTPKKNWGRLNRMGNHLAHIERDSDKSWVQGTLIALGLARVRTSQRNPEMALVMYRLEQQARKNKTGIWEKPEFGILTPDETTNHLHSFQIVEGTIESVSLNKNRIYLNFGKNWREDFTVSIAPEDRQQFQTRNIDPLQWSNKRVRVRGWIESYNGPLIEIDHPQAIELLNQDGNPEASNFPLSHDEGKPMLKTIE